MLGNHTNFILESKSYEITHVFGRLYKTRSSAVRCSGSCTVYPHKVHTQFGIRLYVSSNIHLKCTDESISMFLHQNCEICQVEMSLYLACTCYSKSGVPPLANHIVAHCTVWKASRGGKTDCRG